MNFVFILNKADPITKKFCIFYDSYACDWRDVKEDIYIYILIEFETWSKYL